MDPVRPLRFVLGELAGTGQAAGDVEQALLEAGHGALAPDLLTEAIVSFAAVAPPALAEHLAPFVTADSPAALDADVLGADRGLEVSWGLELIASAPEVSAGAHPDALDAMDGLAALDTAQEVGRSGEPVEHDEPDDVGSGLLDLDFGAGEDAGVGLGPDPAELDGGTEPAGPVPAWSLGEHSTDEPQLETDQLETDQLETGDVGQLAVDQLAGEPDAATAGTEEDRDPPTW